MHDLRLRCELVRRQSRQLPSGLSPAAGPVTFRSTQLPRKHTLSQAIRPKPTFKKKPGKYMPLKGTQGLLLGLKLCYVNGFMPRVNERRLRFQTKVFIGPGNNDWMVKSLFKQRRKVIIVPKMASANVIWTQRPVPFEPSWPESPPPNAGQLS
jgi:hypothetical protein